MSATIETLRREIDAEKHSEQVRLANIRTGMLALVDAYEQARTAIDSGALTQGRSDFVTARAGAGRLRSSMYATPAGRLLTSFIEISHIWTNFSSATGGDRDDARATLDLLSAQIRARFA